MEMIFRRYGHKWDDSIKMDHTEKGCEYTSSSEQGTRAHLCDNGILEFNSGISLQNQGSLSAIKKC
jgi:hypothetical protein